MTKAKAFLLGSVAGLAAVVGAQAADLPVKAKPVQYVKICTLYGDGFYYIPGQDTCIKIGGYVRADYGINAGGSTAVGSGIVPGTTVTATDGLRTRSSQQYSSAHRADVSIDTRTQTQYGVLRTYIDFRVENRLGGDIAQASRAFIQWTGFTFGRARSFFDVFTIDQRYTYLRVLTTGDTNDLGINLAAYTVQLAPNLTFSVSAEDPNRQPVFTGVADGSNSVFATNGVTNLDQHGVSHPDIIANLRYAQPWGYLGVSAAAHHVQGLYYRTGNTTLNPHPSDKWGWAAAVGGELNLPWGDSIGANFVYSLGASQYANRSGSWQLYGSNSVGVGWVIDGLFDTNFAGAFTPIELTRVWSINAGYERRWSPNWATSLYGGYVNVSYNNNAKALINAHLPTPPVGATACGQPVFGAVWPPVNVGTGAGNSCTPNFSYLQVGSRTQWMPVVGLTLGVDIAYTKLFTAYKGAGTYGPVGTRPTTSGIADQDVWSGIFRVQRAFNTQ